jgi:outer membrane protein OmpA-like peptidoglycan-associated protein
MKNKLSTPIMIGTVFLAISACSTIAPNQGIADAQSRLTSDYNDKKIAERGQGDLANAKDAILMAQNDWAKGDKEKSNHQLFMAQTYLDLAETRGEQAKIEAQNTILISQGQMAGTNRTIAGQNQQLSELSNKLDAKNLELKQAKDKLRDYNMQTTELGSTMVLQDVSFETGRSVLMSGGVNRLQPLINYLRLSPDSRVRIEGYTDSVGGADYNMKLSLARANSVKSILTGANIDASRIETYGSGLDKPVATNSTVSGRQSNRRVEITLLKQPGL